MSRESTPVRYQREYSIWDAVANQEITSVHVDGKGQVDVDEQMKRIFGTAGPRDPSSPTTHTTHTTHPDSPRPHKSAYTSPRASPVRLRPILANCGAAPFQRQVKPRLPAQHSTKPPLGVSNGSDPTVVCLGNDIRALEQQNRALHKRVMVQNKLLIAFCEQEVFRASLNKENRPHTSRK